MSAPKKPEKAHKANLKAKTMRPPTKSGPAKSDPAKSDPAKSDPAKSEPVKPRPEVAHSHPPLIVWSADQAVAAPLIRRLQKIRALQGSGVLPDPGAVKTGAQAPEILLLCYSPAETLCRQMAQGTSPGEALEAWMAQAEKVLAVNRRNRRRVHILDLALARRDPVAALARFGLDDFDQPDSAPAPEAPEAAEDLSDPPDQLLLLLAQRCLSGNPQARALAGELEAATAAAAPVADDPDAAFHAWREAGWAREEAGLLQVQTRMMLQEIDLVQQQNRAAHDEVAALSESRVLLEQQFEQRLAQMSQGIGSYQAQLEDLQAAKARLNRKLAEKENAMDATGAHLRDLEAQVGDLTSALAGAAQQSKALETRLHQFETSHSYRLTAPLRALRGLISGRTRGKERGRG